MNFLNSPTHRVLGVIGSPFANSNSELHTEDVSGLYRYAVKNRMPLLYLKALKRLDKLGSLEEEYNKLTDRYVKTVEAISRVSLVLKRAEIDYTFFKSIRPYQEVTVDVDVLIFGAKYKEVIMNDAGYVSLDSGPLSVTFRDIEAEINVDIYNEVGVSRIIYLDKNKLRRRFIADRKLPSGDVVRSLDPYADLLAVIAHSVMKEHMYVLSEYYTTLYYLADMKSGALSSFLSLVDECKISSVVKTHLGITAELHCATHGFVPICLMSLLNELGLNHLELSRVRKLGFHMPHKYHPLTVVGGIIEKLKEGKARKSFAFQASSILKPKFTSSMLKELLLHITRETY